MAVDSELRLGDRHVSLHAQVLERLRQKIIQGECAPGSRLVEESLAAEFGVSRNPVREAIRVAEAEGFVQVLPRRGAVVATPDTRAVEELFVVRAALEPLAAKLAAGRVTPEHLDQLRALLTESERATAREDYGRLAALNSDFHLQVVRAAGNRWLETMATSIFYHVQWVFRLGAADRAPHSWEEHVALLAALSDEDPQRAYDAAQEHVTKAHHAAAVLRGC